MASKLIRIVINPKLTVKFSVPRGDWDEKALCHVLSQTGIPYKCTTGTLYDVVFFVEPSQIDTTVRTLQQYGLDHTIGGNTPDQAQLKIIVG